MSTKTYLADALKVANKIIAECEGKNKKWEDPDFPCGSRILCRRKRVGESVSAWKRPSELAQGPKLFVDGVESGDVMQGSLGDCYFLGAIAVLATRKDLLLPLFVSARPSLGFYQIKFFKNGQWTVVTIDDRLPVDANGKLAFAHCKDTNEFWVPIIEKAYAKLHLGYDAIESGSVSAALMDLTGEAAQTFDFNQGEGLELIKSGKFWNMLVDFEREKYLLGCSCRKGGIESDTGMGILGNHAYSVLQAVEIDGHRLLRIRNPWGHTEWRGKWSDGSREWTPALKKKLNFEFGDDGTFFMDYNNFMDQYDNLFVCRLLTDEVGHKYQHFTVEHEWNRQTAGGCSNHPTWRNNDQWSVTVKKTTNVFFCVMQPDQRMEIGKEDYKQSIGFSLFKVQDNLRKLAQPEPSKLFKSIPYSPSRNVSLWVTVDPGEYILVPTTFDPAVMTFYMHVFSLHPITIDIIGEDSVGKAAAAVSGKWSGSSAGGCMNHNTWINNPKYLLRFDKKLIGGGSIDVEFALTQKGEKSKPCFVGFYLFGGYRDGGELNKNTLIKQTTCINKVEVNLEVRLPSNAGDFVIMPTCFTPDERNEFELRINTKEKFQMAELSGTNGNFNAKNLGDTVKKTASVKRPVKVSEDIGGHGGTVDVDELSEAKRGVTVSGGNSSSGGKSLFGNSSKTAKEKDYDSSEEDNYKRRNEKTTTATDDKPKFTFPNFSFGSGEKEKEKDEPKSPAKPPKDKPPKEKPPKAPKSPSSPPKMKKSKSSSNIFGGSSSSSPSTSPTRSSHASPPKPAKQPKNEHYEPPKQPKPSWTGGGGGGGGGTNVKLHNNNKGDILLTFGKGGGGGTKTKTSTKTVVGPDGRKTKQTTVTTTRYYCGGCGEAVSGKQCGHCGAKLR